MRVVRLTIRRARHMKAPGSRDTFQRVCTSVVEFDAGTDSGATDGFGHEDLPRRGEVANSFSDGHGETLNVAFAKLDLARVDTCTHVQPEVSCAGHDFSRATDSASRTFEGREESVSGRLDLVSAMA